MMLRLDGKLLMYLAWCIVAMLLLAACQPAGPAPCDEEGALFTDDFDPEVICGWAVYERGGAQAQIVDGRMHLIASQPGQIWWTNPGRNLNDVLISATVEHVSGPEDNAFGLICRYQSPENFYVFLISSDGYYAIGKYQTGSSQITYLTGEGEYVFSEAISQGPSSNLMQASCVGNELSLTVNGEMLATVSDPTFVTGDVGLAASTFAPGTLEVAFDNVRVTEP